MQMILPRKQHCPRKLRSGLRLGDDLADLDLVDDNQDELGEAGEFDDAELEDTENFLTQVSTI